VPNFIAIPKPSLIHSSVYKVKKNLEKEEIKKKIDFRQIFNLNTKELINWALDSKPLKKPNYCKLCRSLSGKKYK